jgi:GAF domain-containing protein
MAAHAAARLSDWREDGEPRGAVEHVLAVARRELRMDVALLSEVRDGREIVLWAVGNGRLPEFVPGASAPLRDTVCRRLLDGTIDNIVHDARADERVRDLPAVQVTGLGAYIGVPLTGSAARRYVLCCVARDARPDLSAGDVRFLLGLVESVRPAVDRAAGAS